MLPLLLFLQTIAADGEAPAAEAIERHAQCTVSTAQRYAQFLSDSADLLAIAADMECNSLDRQARQDLLDGLARSGVRQSDAVKQADALMRDFRQHRRDLAIAAVIRTRYEMTLTASAEATSEAPYEPAEEAAPANGRPITHEPRR